MSEACARRERPAMDAVHARFAPGLRALFLRRVGERNADTADELCQRTWMMTWEAIQAGKYDPTRAAISTFLYAVANNAWLRYLRSKGRAALNGHAADLEELEHTIGARAGVADALEPLAHAEELHAMRAALAGRGSETLTPEELAVITGSARGETDRALAASLGFAASTINGKKQSALAKLRRIMAALGVGEDGDRLATSIASAPARLRSQDQAHENNPRNAPLGRPTHD